MVSYWPLSIVEHGLGLNITVMSYAGAVGFGFTAALCAVPDADAFTAALQDALDELQAPRGGAAAKPSARPPRARRTRAARPAAPPAR